MTDGNEGARARTWDLLLKRQLLYQLSYAPAGSTTLSHPSRRAYPKTSRWSIVTCRSYYHAIKFALDAAERGGVKFQRWNPHRIRHTFATKVAQAFGIETARASAGHVSLSATELYVERDLSQAKEVAWKMG